MDSQGEIIRSRGRSIVHKRGKGDCALMHREDDMDLEEKNWAKYVVPCHLATKRNHHVTPHSLTLTFSSPLFLSPFFLLSFLFCDLLLHSILSHREHLGRWWGLYELDYDVWFVITFCFGYSRIPHHLPHVIFVFLASLSRHHHVAIPPSPPHKPHIVGPCTSGAMEAYYSSW